MNVVWLTWCLLAGSTLLVFAALMTALWQLYLRREMQALCAENCNNLQYLREQRDQLEKQVQELSAGLRAEKAHVTQLQRQLQLVRLEL